MGNVALLDHLMGLCCQSQYEFIRRAINCFSHLIFQLLPDVEEVTDGFVLPITISIHHRKAINCFSHLIFQLLADVEEVIGPVDRPQCPVYNEREEQQGVGNVITTGAQE